MKNLIAYLSIKMRRIWYMVITKRLDGVNGMVPLAKYSAIKANAQRLERLGISFETLLRGTRSLGKYLGDNGVKSIPSPEYPSPNGKCFMVKGKSNKI